MCACMRACVGACMCVCGVCMCMCACMRCVGCAQRDLAAGRALQDNPPQYGTLLLQYLRSYIDTHRPVLQAAKVDIFRLHETIAKVTWRLEWEVKVMKGYAWQQRILISKPKTNTIFWRKGGGRYAEGWRKVRGRTAEAQFALVDGSFWALLEGWQQRRRQRPWTGTAARCDSRAASVGPPAKRNTYAYRRSICIIA